MSRRGAAWGGHNPLGRYSQEQLEEAREAQERGAEVMGARIPLGQIQHGWVAARVPLQERLWGLVLVRPHVDLTA